MYTYPRGHRDVDDSKLKSGWGTDAPACANVTARAVHRMRTPLICCRYAYAPYRHCDQQIAHPMPVHVGVCMGGRARHRRRRPPAHIGNLA